MLETRIARRYLWAARKERHTAFLSLISMLGLAVGVATLLISIALLSGLQGQIKARLIASSPQVLIEPRGSNTIANAEAIVAAARAAGAREVRASVSGIGWGANEPEGRGRPMRIRSTAGPAKENPPAIALTRDFAMSIGLDAGDEVTVVAPRTRLTPFGPMPVVRTYVVGRLLPPTGEPTPVDAELPEEEAAALFGTTGPTSIEIYGDETGADAMQAMVGAKFPGVEAKTWKEINRPLFLALRLEKVVMFVTISLIIFVAALNLISSLSMLIMEKRPAVGVLRTLGATDRSILSIFLQVGLLIGLTGTLLGNIIGVGFSWAANRFQLVPLPRDIYFVPYLPFQLDGIDIAGVNLIAVLLSIFATWYPARVASRLDPIAAIREE